MSWTKTPPTEPGWYYMRKREVQIARLGRYKSANGTSVEYWEHHGRATSSRPELLVADGFEFWHEPIPPPKE